MDPRPRLRRPDRNQLHLRAFDLEELVPPDHLARAIWAVVEKVDLRELYEKIGSVEGGPGAPATDPAVLLALWLFATCEGVGSARELDRRCHRDAPYMWLCGGLTTNHTSLALFRARNPDFLDGLLATSVATLATAGFVNLETIAVDGRRIRANASAASFRSREALDALHAKAKALVDALKARLEDEDAGDEATNRAAAARRKADEDRLRRIEDALKAVTDAEATKERNRPKRTVKATPAKKSKAPTSDAPSLFPPGATAPQVMEAEGDAATGRRDDDQDGIERTNAPLYACDSASEGTNEAGVDADDGDDGDGGSSDGGAAPAGGAAEPGPRAPRDEKPTRSADSTETVTKQNIARASTTDPDARVMKMADGGYRPAYNCQTVVSAEHSVILHVSVETVGSDAGLLLSAVRSVETKYKGRVEKVLADGGYVNLDAIQELEGRAEPTAVYMPPPRPRGKGSTKRGRYTRLAGDSEQLATWRERLGTPEGMQTYRKRSQVAELPHAGYANRGFNQVRTRRRDRVRSELLLQAIANNLKIQLRLMGPSAARG